MKLVLLGVLCVALLLVALQLRAAEGPATGSAAPDFALPDQQGTVHHLSEFRGKWVVLYFYPKDETPGCTTEACNFRDDWQQLTALNAQVIGISVDDSRSHAAFAGKHRLPFLLLADSQGEVVERYGALLNLAVVKFAKRHTYVIAPDGKIAQAYRNVDPAKHSREVIAYLKQAQAAR